ncbi:hypothetical protein ACFQI7_28430 [Paenibacillus allorhizosphaerae]|uniref:hypothetical protein n=1 Tax=Paenibacillus allorhizosphaerae TaxID=2849866 RepID=UPI001C40406B|nr:hypothetical protein [Paenibacillus allorhizosphaerae]
MRNITQARGKELSSASAAKVESSTNASAIAHMDFRRFRETSAEVFFRLRGGG